MGQKRQLSPEQDLAANPSENIWVQANAGTGKTSVLIQRLLRILFRSENLANCGVLCLTYTNAAAGEMRNRILAALREWAVASDDELREMLHSVSSSSSVTDGDVERARTIFFAYIDRPDILKIKTIHSFCEEILHRFPLEAGLSPAWSLISDSAQRVLLQDAFLDLINGSKIDANANDAFEHIVGRVSENFLDDLLSKLSEQYKYFFQVKDYVKYRKYFIDTIKKFLKLNLQKPTGPSIDNLKNIIKLATEEQNSKKKPAEYLNDIINLTQQYIDKTIDFKKYQTLYLTEQGAPKKTISKKEYLCAEQMRVYDFNQYELNMLLYQDTVALFDLSAAFARVYQDLKQTRNVLDFDDLILYTRRLFSNPETMGWVLSQLDLSLSHILVDEAQDTGPAQWDILRMLSGDFFAEGDTEKQMRSLFVVGDSKQSIYGFQGADPHAFIDSRNDIAAHIKNNLRTIADVPLLQSFRSSPSVLRAVDEFFSNSIVVAQTGFKNDTHICFRRNAPGLVEINKLIAKNEDNTTILQYIKTIANNVQELISSGKFLPRDIMILVQNRHPMAAPMVAELKRRNIDVAGSDRIILPRFPAVRDMLRLVRFCLDISDDYSLCCVLRSPIFRLNERDIFDICSIRNKENVERRRNNKDAALISVFEVLQNIRPDIYSYLDNIISWAAQFGPYTFFSKVLNTNDVRSNMISALGDQVVDPLEEFLTICLSYERTQPGTLRHFLKWFITGGAQVKRDMDAANGVRVVTVHGSKGLEAPVVFLIDTVNMPSTETILPIPCENTNEFPTPWIWSPRTNHSDIRNVAADANSDIRIAEYYRLLYVAMTRARDHLYVYGFTPYKNAPELSWHAMLWRVLSNVVDAKVTDKTIRISNGE